MILEKKSIRILPWPLVVAAPVRSPSLLPLRRQRGGRCGADLDDAAGQIKTVVNTVVFPALPTWCWGLALS